MSEPKYIYRFVPCPAYRVEAIQTWLEDLAREGLILEKDTFLFGVVTFTRQSPRNYRYRLEATPDIPGIFNDYDTPDYRAVELNESFGWEYVTRYGQFYIYRCADPTAPELHTDPAVESAGYEKAQPQRPFMEHFQFLLSDLAEFGLHAHHRLRLSGYPSDCGRSSDPDGSFSMASDGSAFSEKALCQNEKWGISHPKDRLEKRTALLSGQKHSQRCFHSFVVCICLYRKVRC